ncbi:MAG: hypothetical protein ACQESF_01100 [Nanobdellota archaeon]
MKIINIFLALLIFSAIAIAECPDELGCDGFDWDNADYSEINWENVKDFKDVRLTNPEIDWDKVDQSRITGSKVSEIPVACFNPDEIKSKYLKHATKYQIRSNLGEFDNLCDADLKTVGIVFSGEPYNADIDFFGADKMRFDEKTGELIGDFPSFKPATLPKNEFSIAVSKGKIFIEDKEKGDVANISSANSFSYNDGVFNFGQGEDAIDINGKINGKINLNDGTSVFFKSKDSLSMEGNEVLCYDCEATLSRDGKKIHINGNFEKKKDNIVIKSYSAKQSKLEFKDQGLSVKTVGYPVSFDWSASSMPDNLEGNSFYYEDGVLKTHGSLSIKTDEYILESKDKNARAFLSPGKVQARGKLDISTKEFSYRSHKDSAFFQRKQDSDSEDVLIKAEEGGMVADYKEYIKIRDLFSGDSKGSSPLHMKISKVDDDYKVDKKYFDKSLQRISMIETGIVDPYFWVEKQKGFSLTMGEDDQVTYDMNLNANLIHNDKNSVEYVNPNEVVNFLGENADNQGKLLSREVLKSFEGSIVQNLEKGRKVAYRNNKGKLKEAKVVSKEGTAIGLDFDGDGVKDKIIDDEREAFGGAALESVHSLVHGAGSFLGGTFSTPTAHASVSGKKNFNIAVVPVNSENLKVVRSLISGKGSGSSISVDIHSPGQMKFGVDKDVDYLIPTGHHYSKSLGKPDDYIFGDNGERLYYEDMPPARTIIQSSCASVPEIDTIKPGPMEYTQENWRIRYNQKVEENNRQLRNYLKNVPEDTEIIAGYTYVAPTNDDTVKKSLTPDMMKLREENPEEYIRKMIDISKENAAKNAGRATKYSLIVNEAVGLAGFSLPGKKPYEMGALYKKEGKWMYYDWEHPEGIPAFKEKVSSGI